MNKFINMCFVAAFAVIVPMAGYCDGETDDDAATQSVAARTDCAAVKSRIDELSKISAPDSAVTQELTTLQSTYRRDCAKNVAGRRSSGRSATNMVSADATADVSASGGTVSSGLTVSTALSQFYTDKNRICNNLSSNIASLTRGGATTQDLQPLIDRYHIDCMGENAVAEGKDAATSAEKSKPVEIDIETATANVAAGLCTDGSKPNKFGCCAGETFKDLGNLVFACCPEDGESDCYPPIK